MGSKRYIQLSYGSMILFFICPVVALVYNNPVNNLFHPLQSLDISTFYTRYHYWVDLFIFLLFFIAVGKITVARRFGGREGKVLWIKSHLSG